MSAANHSLVGQGATVAAGGADAGRSAVANYRRIARPNVNQLRTQTNVRQPARVAELQHANKRKPETAAAAVDPDCQPCAELEQARCRANSLRGYSGMCGSSELELAPR